MKQYTVAMGVDAMLLAEDVNRFLSDGWECQGGIAICLMSSNPKTDGKWFMQAMVREKPPANKVL